MSGLKDKRGFVGANKKGFKRSRKNYGVFAGALLVIGIVMLMTFVSMYANAYGEAGGANIMDQGTTYMVGKGGTTPYICYGDNVFIMTWFGKDSSGNWMLNATQIDLNGNIVKTVTLTNDLALYNNKPSGMGSRIAYDPDDNIFMVLWYSANDSLDGLFMNSNLTQIGHSMVINSTVSVNYHAFSITYIGNSRFIVVWNDNSYDNYYRIITYSNGSAIMGTIGKISGDASHSHLNNVVSYDSKTGHILVIWRNSTGKSGVYNITGKIFDSNMSQVIKNDFTIANGYTKGMSYDIPNVAAGDGVFMIIYANRSAPYTVSATMINASTGEIMNNFTIGNSYVGVKYYGMGIAYNGSGGFMVAWPNSDKNIEATLYSENGKKIFTMSITNTTDSEESPMVAVSEKISTTSSETLGATNQVYQFVWYDYTTGEVYTANYSSGVFVPEFSAFLPILIVAVVACIAIKRRY